MNDVDVKSLVTLVGTRSKAKMAPPSVNKYKYFRFIANFHQGVKCSNVITVRDNG